MKKNTLITLSLLFSLILSLFACRKDIEFYVDGKETPAISILESAKIWRSQHLATFDNTLNLKPYWDDAWVISNNDGKTLIVVPSPERKIISKEISIRRFFIFSARGGTIADGNIVEFVAEKSDVKVYLDDLLKNMTNDGISNFSGWISKYDINYQYLTSYVFKNGRKSKIQSKIVTRLPDLSINPGPISVSFNSNGKLSSARGKVSNGSIVNCVPVTPLIVGEPFGICTNAFAIYREDWTADKDGCLLSLVYTYVQHTCPSGAGTGDSGAGSGEGSGSGSGESGSGSSQTTGGNPSYGGPSGITFMSVLFQNPFALFGDDVPCEILKQWLAMAKFAPDNSVIDKLTNVALTYPTPTGFVTIDDVARIQKIDHAYSSVVNLDYFPVTITELPIINGHRYTAGEFLHYIRVNINNFTGGQALFSPYNAFNVNDINTWNSSSPKGAMVSIDFVGPDNGSVITSESSTDHWTFTTIHEPKYGAHPVSGNRTFGYTENANGSHTFYVKGVDRLTTPDATLLQAMSNIPFSASDSLWEKFQSELATFVGSHYGSSNIGTPNTFRPKWADVKSVLDGFTSPSSLSRDCPD